MKQIKRAIKNSFIKIVKYKENRYLAKCIQRGLLAQNNFSFENLRNSVLNYIDGLKIGNKPWEYAYSYSSPYSSLYSSTYVLMLRSMFLGPSAGLTAVEKKEFSDYFLSFQDPSSGYFIDKTLEDGEYLFQENENYLWWGYGHCLMQVLQCLKILEIQPQHDFYFLEDYYDLSKFNIFLNSLNFTSRVHYTGNILMNIGVALQYEKFIRKTKHSQQALNFLKNFLKMKLNKKCLWGDLKKKTADERSINIQGAYHFWPLFFFDHDNIPISSELLDYLLESQNSLGGFGVDPFHSSACEDIDSIEPLSRFYPLLSTEYKAKIKKSFLAALPWILANQNADGGFVFWRNRELHYGHDHLYSRKNESALFPTWFRVLCLAHLMKTISKKENFYFCNCPGFLY